MKKTVIIFVLTVMVLPVLPVASRPAEAGIVKNIALYLPNRIFDVLDIVRLRLRVGPGLSAGVCATEAAEVFVGYHDSVYGGLPGPRGKPQIPRLLGIEKRSGTKLSVIDLSESNLHNDPLGLGIQGQLGIIGLNIAVNFFEVLDVVTGFALIDIAKDDF